MFKKRGDIDEVYEESEIDWKVSDFMSIPDNEIIESPTFSFADSSWVVRLTPKGTELFGIIVCALVSTKYSPSVKYNLGLKKLDGSVEQLGEGIFKSSIATHFFNLSKVVKQQIEVASSEAITITCTLKRGRSRSQQPGTLSTRKLENLIKLDTLSDNFKDLIENKESCDTTLNVHNKEYKAHRAVLIARSSVFAAMFLHDTSEKQTGIVTILDCDPESFGEFLKFLYSGKLEKPSFLCALHLYETSDKYEVQELKTFCVEYLTENLTVENVCDVVILADKYEEAHLINAAQDFFNINASKIIETSQWDCLVKDNYRLSKRLLREMIIKKDGK